MGFRFCCCFVLKCPFVHVPCIPGFLCSSLFWFVYKVVFLSIKKKIKVQLSCCIRFKGLG